VNEESGAHGTVAPKTNKYKNIENMTFLPLVWYRGNLALRVISNLATILFV
jgi:hypothetical protein